MTPEQIKTLLNDISDPTIRSRVELAIADEQESVSKLTKNNARLLDENRSIKEQYSVPDRVTITRDDAHNYRKYQAAKARAEKAGVKLEIIDDSPDAKAALPAKHFGTDDTFYVTNTFARDNAGMRLAKLAKGRDIVYVNEYSLESQPAEVQAALQE